jgi:hypothetical protein
MCSSCQQDVLSTKGFVRTGLFASGRAAVINWLAQCTRATRSPPQRLRTAAPSWPSAPSAAAHSEAAHPHSAASQYNLMLHDTHGVDVGDRMYLLRMHADRDAFELVQCRDLRAEAREALRAEPRRLVARPPPAAPPAAASPPQAATAAPSAQGAAGALERPRGAAPKGMIWSGGKWVDARCAKKARTPGTETALNVRPAHGARKGMAWDGVAGCWVACRKGFQKRARPVEAHDDENVPPQRRDVRRRA